MARAISEPNLPWVEQAEDRAFRWLSATLLILFLIGGVILNVIDLPEAEKKNLVDVSPRLAKLILEKQKIPAPPKPKPKPEKKKEAKKDKPKKEKPKKKKPKKKQKAKQKSDKEVAQQSGLIALADELEDLRESFELDDVLKLPQTNQGKEEVKVATANDLLSATAGQSSGGIRTNTLNRSITTSELTQRQTTKVESKIQRKGTKVAKAESAAGKSKSGIRSTDEIERVFQKNKGSIFNLYNRALRKNPSLAGQVVVELTIAGNGTVTAVKILSSELGDKALERKLILKIKKFKFTRSNAAAITITYPIDFLPS